VGSVLSSRRFYFEGELICNVNRFYFDGGLIWNVESLYGAKPSGHAGPSEFQTSVFNQLTILARIFDAAPTTERSKMGWDGSSM
jgi:hypothetical protein